MGSAATSALLVLPRIACYPSHDFVRLNHACVSSEGLGLKSTITSSLVLVNDYANASIYIDLSANTEYRSYKVFRVFDQFDFMSPMRNVSSRSRSSHTIPTRAGLALSLSIGTRRLCLATEYCSALRVLQCFPLTLHVLSIHRAEPLKLRHCFLASSSARSSFPPPMQEGRVPFRTGTATFAARVDVPLTRQRCAKLNLQANPRTSRLCKYGCVSVT